MKKIYLTKEAGLDSDKKYIVSCELHNTMLGCETRAIASKTRTKDFCEECK